MAYRMEYGFEPHIIGVNKKEKRRFGLGKLFVLCILIAITIFCVTTDILIPGDPAVTKAAFHDFVGNLREGEQVVDAFAAFCQCVLQGT